MPMKYNIEEFSDKGTIRHGFKLSSGEAHSAALDIRNRTGNPVSVEPEYVSIYEVDDEDFPGLRITAEDIYKESHGRNANIVDAGDNVRKIYELCAETATRILNERRGQILPFVKRSAETGN